MSSLADLPALGRPAQPPPSTTTTDKKPAPLVKKMAIEELEDGKMILIVDSIV